jgi:hypothetical protein
MDNKAAVDVLGPADNVNPDWNASYPGNFLYFPPEHDHSHLRL